MDMLHLHLVMTAGVMMVWKWDTHRILFPLLLQRLRKSGKRCSRLRQEREKRMRQLADCSQSVRGGWKSLRRRVRVMGVFLCQPAGDRKDAVSQMQG